MPVFKNKLPLMGLGTFIGIEADEIADHRKRKETVKKTVIHALTVGYRHIDVAESYNNLEAIGEALQHAMKPESEGGLGIKRQELWLTMKSDNYSNEAINRYLNALGVDYLDTFMLHHPFNYEIFDSEEALHKTWNNVTDISHHLVKNFGISNCYKEHVSRLIDVCEKYNLPRPFSNEIETNLICPNHETIEYCQKHGIQVIAYSPLGYNYTASILESRALISVANRSKSTPAQAILAWHMERGVAVIPKTTKTKRLKENFAATAYINTINAEAKKKLSSMGLDGPDGLTYMAEAAKKHSLSLKWSVLSEPVKAPVAAPIVRALMNELNRLKSKAENSNGFSVGWFWHANYQDKVTKVEKVIKKLEQNATLTDDLVKTEIINPDSQLYKALNQHTGHFFGGLLNGFTLTRQTGGIVASETRAILNIKAAIPIDLIC